MKKFISSFLFTVMSLVALFAATPAQAEEATLTVNVTDEKGAPVAGAFATIYNPYMEVETNAEGVAKFTGIDSETVSGKKIAVSVMKDFSFAEAEADFTTTLNAVVNVTLSDPTFTFTINVVSGDYEPVAGATVYILDQELTTDDKGKAELPGVPMSSLESEEVPYSVYKDGYEFFEGTIYVDGENPSGMATLVASEASLTIKVVTGEEYDPVADALVTFQGKEYTTNENGQVTITGISAPDVLFQEIDYTVYKDGYDFYEGKALFDMLEAQAIANLVPAEATLTVKVITGEDYDPVAGATVTFQGKEYTTNENGQVTITGISAPDVLFQEIGYSVYKDGYDYFEGVALFDMLEAQAIATLVPVESIVTFKVVTGEENDPVAEAMVTFMDKDYTTDENGEVKVTLSAPDVIGKEIPFTAYKDGYEFFEGVVVFDALEAWGVAQLVPAKATISVKVITGEENDPVAEATVTVAGKEYFTDANGEVKISGLNGPDVIGTTIPVTITKEGYETLETVADFSETLDALVLGILVPDESSINAIKAAIAGSKVYDLQGRIITTPHKGQVYIINGRKVRL